MAKRPRFSNEEDGISRLPDELLCHIVSLLPLKQAFCTSVLSTRWSKIFTLMPNLHIEHFSSRRKSDSVNFMNFVDRILFQHSGIIDKFRLKCGKLVDSHRVNGWIEYAVFKCVRELDLCLQRKDSNRIHFKLFKCETLVSLRLNIYDSELNLELPVNICLPSLKILHVSGIEFPDERFFSSCPVLEELVVNRCSLRTNCILNVSCPALKRLTLSCIFGDNEILIDAPSLIYFDFTWSNQSKLFVLKNLNSIVEAHIRVDYYVRGNRDATDILKAETDILKGICNVQSLHLYGKFGQIFLEENYIIPKFPKLTYFRLGDYFIIKKAKIVADLLLCFPRLEALACRVSFPMERVPCCLLNQLKEFRISTYDYHQRSLFEMVTYILKNGRVLEKLTIRTSQILFEMMKN